MSATKELIEATEYLLSQFGKQDHLCDYGARPRAEAALAAAKEEQGKVLKDAGYRAGESADGEFLVWHESNNDEAIAAIFPTEHRERVIDLIVSPRYLAHAKGSGLTVEGAVAAVMSVWENTRFHSAAHNVEGDIRKALEDLAVNRGDNLRTDPWTSAGKRRFVHEQLVRLAIEAAFIAADDEGPRPTVPMKHFEEIVRRSFWYELDLPSPPDKP